MCVCVCWAGSYTPQFLCAVLHRAPAVVRCCHTDKQKGKKERLFLLFLTRPTLSPRTPPFSLRCPAFFLFPNKGSGVFSFKKSSNRSPLFVLFSQCAYASSVLMLQKREKRGERCRGWSLTAHARNSLPVFPLPFSISAYYPTK